MARHFGRLRKPTNEFDRLLNREGNRIVHVINIPQIQKKVNKKKPTPLWEWGAITKINLGFF